jgi:hypothetical protein
MIEPSRMRWMEHAVRMDDMRKIHKLFSKNLKERKNLDDLFVDERIILASVLGKQKAGLIHLDWDQWLATVMSLRADEAPKPSQLPCHLNFGVNKRRGNS